MKMLGVVLGALVGAAVAQSDCKKQLMGCMADGFTDYQSPTIDEWKPVLKEKAMMKLKMCAMKNRCVKDFECLMEAGMKYKEGVDSCAPMVAMFKSIPDQVKEEMKAMKMLKLVADKPKLMLFADAVCHPDDAKSFAKCMRKAVEPAFLVMGPKLLHMKLNKKECIKGLPQECKAEWAQKVEDSCSCTAALKGSLDDMKANVSKACGNDTFPEGVDVAKIHSFMSAKYCSSKKDKLCYKSAKACMKESMPAPMAKLDGMPGAKKAQMMLGLMSNVMPKMGECFAASADDCVQDIECGMKAMGKYKRKVEGCQGLVQRWAFMPKEGRMKLKMMKWVELVFGDEMGPKIMKAMCKTPKAAKKLRKCLKGAVDKPFRGMLKAGLNWFKDSMQSCVAQASDECQERWASKLGDKCSCASALAEDAEGVAEFVQKKCRERKFPAGAVNFGAVFKVKMDKYCSAGGAPSQ